MFVGLPQGQKLVYKLGICFSSLRKRLVVCQFFFLPFSGIDGEKLFEMTMIYGQKHMSALVG